MKIQRTFAFSLLLVCTQVASLNAGLASQSPAAGASSAASRNPVVRKIEPPNWWVNYTPELTLLLTGENLTGAKVESSAKGIAIIGSETSANGHYLFVRLQLNSDLSVQAATFRLVTSTGSTTFSLPFLARSDSRGRFEGISRDDVIYLIMPDRFADGDPSNNQPPGTT